MLRKCRSHCHLDVSTPLSRYFKTCTKVHDKSFDADYEFDIIQYIASS